LPSYSPKKSRKDHPVTITIEPTPPINETAYVAIAAIRAGYELLALAPSWKATDVFEEAFAHGSELDKWFDRVQRAGIEVSSNTLIVVDEDMNELLSQDDLLRLRQFSKDKGARIHFKASVKKLSKLEEAAKRHREQARAEQPAKIADARHQSFVGKYHPAEFEKLLDKIPHATMSESITAYVLSVMLDAMYWHGQSVREAADKEIAKLEGNIIFSGGLQDPETGKWCALENGPGWSQRRDAETTSEALAPLLDVDGV
jgi:hypothetical protein